jgi:Flp pilus assembly protein TadD
MISTDAATGMKLARMGRFADALPYLDRANRIAPTDVPLLHALASLLLWAKRGGAALDRYQLAASLLPEDTSVLSGWARSLLLTGARDQASSVLERALAIDPDYASPGGLLDQLLREADDMDVACSVLQPLVDRNPLHVGLLGQYGKALLATERLQEAQAVYERYCVLRPQDPLPRVELGGLAVSRGDSVSALEHFRSALEVDPGYAAALWGFAQVKDWQLEPEMLALVQRLSQSERNPRALAGLHDVLARHHARTGDFAAASLHATHTNVLMQQIVPPQKRYDASQHEIDIDNTIRSNTPQLYQRLRDAGSRERRPVFVIGLPRSGTTLLEQMLASHPGIVGVGEQSIAAASLQRALATSGGSLELLGAPAVGEAAAWHLQMLEQRLLRLAIQQRTDRIVDKLPDNYLLAGWLHIAFPNAAIIHCLRDPRDVALSCWLTQFADVQWSYDLQHIAHRIEQHRRLMQHWRTTIGDHVTEIRYERLVVDPETELRRVLAAIQLDWHPDVLAFAGRKGFVASASRQQVREPIHARSVARWRNYEHALQPILPRLNAIAALDALDADCLSAP